LPTPQEIKGYFCPKCGWADFFATSNCPRCHSEIKEGPLPDRGKVATFTIIRYPPLGFEQEAPYVVALIDLDNGPRVIGRIAGTPELLQIGTHVTLTGCQNGALQFVAS
jgi:uncharacterized OB-fold protein